MKKNLLAVLVFSCLAFVANAQNFPMATSTVNVDCVAGGTLYDSGGVGGSYTDGQNIVMTICPGTPGFGVFANMDGMTIASGDVLNIYNGDDISAPIFPDMPLDQSTDYGLGAQFQATVTNPTGCLTFEFISNTDGTVGDFEFSLTCNARCQTVYSSIVSTIPDTTFTPTDVYIDVCLGDTVFVAASDSFPENNTEYAQSNATSTFEWYWDLSTPLVDTGITQSHFYDSPGGYVAKLISYDVNGCRNFLDQIFKVRVAPNPEFVALTDTIMCLGETDTLTGLPQGVFVGGQVVQGDTVYFVPPFESGDSTFLPDGNGAIYSSPALITGFDNGSLIEDCGNILEICINMEHSYIGDLLIELVCPNGQSVILKDYPGGADTYLGNPLDPGTTAGTGLNYCFSDNSLNGLLVNGPTQPATLSTGNTIVPNTYQPVNPFTDLIGCPINGLWELQITDYLTIDDGYIFNWSLGIDPCMYPDVDSFIMVYDLGYWDADPTITGIVGDSNTITIEPAVIGPSQYVYHTQNQFGCDYENTYEIFTDGFDVNATPSDTAACAGEAIPLSSVVVGPPGTYTYNWSPPTDLNNPNIANPTSTLSTVGIQYVVGATSGIGCTYYDTVNVNIAASFEFDAYGDTVICFGDSTQIFATGGALTYAWTPNDGFISDTSVANPFVYPGSTTTYTVKADSTGCSQYENITISVSNINPTVIPNTPATCGVANGAVIVVGNGSLGDISYSIDGNAPQTSPVFTGLYGGNHTVVLSDTTHCSVTTNAFVAGGGAPIIIDSVFLQDPSCGIQGIIEIFLSDTSLTVSYTNDSTGVSQDSALFEGLAGGTYTISISDGVCPTVDTTVNLIPSDAAVLSLDSSSNISCFNALDGEIHLSASGGLVPYTFSIDSVSFVSSGSFIGLDTGTYNIMVLDASGCLDNSTISITQPDSLQIENVVVDSALCFGLNGNISFDALGGTAPYMYSVDGVPSFGSSNNYVLPVGNYTLQVQDTNNCVSEILLDTIFEPAALTVNIDSVTNSSCSLINGAIFVSHAGGTAPYTYSWADATMAVVGVSEDLDPINAGIYTLTITDANNCTVQITEQVFDNASVVLSLVSNDSVSCFGADDATVVLNADFGDRPYVFDIDGNPGQADSTFTNVSGGLHTFTVTDSLGCSNSVLVNVFEPTDVNLSNTSSNLTCHGIMDGEIVLTASGGAGTYLYALNTSIIPSASGVFNPLSAATYNAYVSDMNGCSDTITGIVISEPDTLVIANVVSLDVSCFGAADASISITAQGGTLPYEYTVNGTVQTSNIYTGLSGGNYIINLTDANNCPVAVALDTILEPSELILSLDSLSNVTCFGGNDANIEISATGGSGSYAYSINGGTDYFTTNVFNSLSAGNYSLLVEDDNNCPSTVLDTIISEPAQMNYTYSSQDVTCFGFSDGSITIDAINGGTAPFTISLNGAPAIPYTVGMVFDNLIGNSTYNIEIFDGSSCTFNQDITIGEAIALELIENSNTDISCFGLADGEVNLSVTGGTANYTYILNGNSITNDGTTEAVFSDLIVGSYPTYLLDANGCADTLIVDITSPEQLFIDSLVELSPISCFGANDGSLVVYASGGFLSDTILGDYSYLWSPDGSTDHKVSGISPGVYTVVVTDDNDCSVTGSYTISEVDPIIATIIPDSSLISMGDTVQLDLIVQNTVGPLTYSWSPTGGLSCTDCSNPSVTAFNDVQYSVVVTDTNGCSNYNYTETFVLVDNSLFYFIPNSFSPNNDGLNDVFEVYGQDIQSVDMKIFNRWGEKIFQGTNQFQAWDGKYKGVEQTAGVYTYLINVKFLNDAEVVKTGSITLLK